MWDPLLYTIVPFPYPLLLLHTHQVTTITDNRFGIQELHNQRQLWGRDRPHDTVQVMLGPRKYTKKKSQKVLHRLVIFVRVSKTRIPFTPTIHLANYILLYLTVLLPNY